MQLKKLAARCFTAGQAGQYNFKRRVDRGELVAAHWGLSQFIEAVTSAVYLLNKKYRPFYKWMHRGLTASRCWAMSCTSFCRPPVQPAGPGDA